jgi:hypothetical protein
MVQIDCSKWGRVIVDGKNYFSDLYVYWDC